MMAFKQSVLKLAHEIIKHELTLIYGGSSFGMMGLLATTVKESGGRVIGVITRHLIEQERPLDSLDELIVVDSMQERKKIMQQLSDVFIAMPGGLGTLEEAIETWNAIKIKELDKPFGFLNIEGYFDKLFDFIGNCRDYGFIQSEQANIPFIEADPESLLNELILDTESAH